jgi:hypothetical protein
MCIRGARGGDDLLVGEAVGRAIGDVVPNGVVEENSILADDPR